jgi:hypothetical protein
VCAQALTTNKGKKVKGEREVDLERGREGR